MSTRIVSWNPVVGDEFAQTGPNLELCRIEDDASKRDSVVVASLPKATNISCMDWQSAAKSPLLAYGTQMGSLNVVNWRGLYEQNLFDDSSKSTKRAINSISWSLADSGKIVAGLEASKSAESCIMIWDVDQNRALKFQHYESCTSLSWFPGSCTTVVSGSAMGWVKVFDTRSNSQSPVIQWLAHPANRPRKIKGLRPDCFHDSNILATFSDAYGDFVKVWDLRQIPTRNSTKKTGILQAFGINPYFAGHDISNVSGVINDCAWSTIRSGVIAVATSSQRCVSFFRYKEDQPQDNSVNTVSSMPLYTISTPDQVKSLSWQSVDSSKVWASTSSATDNNVLLLNDASTTELSSEQANKYEFMEFSDKRKNDILKFEHKLSKQPNRTGTSKRLLGALQTGVYDMDVRDDIPFSFGNNILAVVHSSGRLGISATSIDQLNVPQCKVLSSLTLSEKLLYCFKDQNQLMKDRASSGYSLDASTNIDILTEELNCLHKSMISNTDTSLNMANMALSNAVYEVYRVWDWLDRFEASNDSKESIQKSGILHVLNIQDVGRVSEIKAKIDESFVTFHPESGAPTYHSKNRAIIRKLCGWVNTQLLDGSNNNSTSSLPSSAANHGKFKSFSWGDLPVQSESSIAGGENDLLVHIVENCMQYSFERAAIVALWHGDLSYAVRILHDAVDSHNKSKLPLFTSSHNYSDQGRNLAGSKVLYEENADNENDIDEISSGTKDSSVEWDYPVTDNYMQVVALVGMCIAGYYPNHSEPKSIQVSRDRQSWKTMCEHVLYQLRAFERTAASYLSAGCLFLLANCSETKMNQNSVQRYMNILDDPNLVLEDRISFASNYLDDEDLVSWLIQLKLTCMKKGSLEGLLLTGLSHQGCDILQGFIDRTHDIQTAALISSRVMHLQESNSNKEDEQAHSRIVIWLHSYRTLLTKWQMNIERAHLDIEIGQLVQKNKQSKASKSASSKGDIVHAGRGRGGVGPQQQRIPIYEGALTKTSKLMQFSFVKLKCNFCNAFLPMDDLPSTRTEGLRSSKSILNCCASCGKQLPRCYVCQLHMGMVNPYLQAQRLAEEMRAINLLNFENPIKDKCQPPTGYTLTGNKVEDSLISFGRWFLFCQRCRHGGHSGCISSWFAHHRKRAEKSEVYCALVGDQRQQSIATICGVNGCNCECQWTN